MRYSKLFIFNTLFFCLLTSQKADSKERQEQNEDFITFLSDFSSLQEFQLKRLADNFIECEITTNGDSSCATVVKKNWKFVKLVQGNTISHIYDNFNLKTNDTNERVFAIERVEGGSATFYYFERKRGQWFLIKRVIYL